MSWRLAVASSACFYRSTTKAATGWNALVVTTQLGRRTCNTHPKAVAFLGTFHTSARCDNQQRARGKTQQSAQSKPKNNNKKNKKSMTDDLFRADRVLKERTDMPRSKCFELLKKKRIWQKISQTEDDDEENDETIKNGDDGDGVEWTAVPGPSTKIYMHTPLWIDRIHLVPLPPPLLMVYHKPKWVLSVSKDSMERPCLDKSIVGLGMHVAGRLDYDSSGLLLFSSSGQLTQKLLHPKHEIPKIYEVTVCNRVEQDKLAQQLAEGVETGEGVHTVELLSVEHFADEAVAPFLADVQAKTPPNHHSLANFPDVFEAKALSTVTLRVVEGKYRMVRRIMANCGHPVVKLVRRKFGEICLDDLPEGSVRALTVDEEQWIESIVGKDSLVI